MYNISIKLGGLLIVISLLGWVIDGFGSITALIPTFLGIPIVFCGIQTKKHPEKTKLYMHIAAGCVLLIFGGSASRVPHLDGSDMIKDTTIWSTLVVSFILLGLYIQSFIKARTSKDKEG